MSSNQVPGQEHAIVSLSNAFWTQSSRLVFARLGLLAIACRIKGHIEGTSTGIRMHYTPEHCNLSMVVSNLFLVLKKQHVSNGGKTNLFSPVDSKREKLPLDGALPLHVAVGALGSSSQQMASAGRGARGTASTSWLTWHTLGWLRNPFRGTGQKPWFLNDSLVNPNKKWLPMFSRWCEQSLVYPQ